MKIAVYLQNAHYDGQEPTENAIILSLAQSLVEIGHDVVIRRRSLDIIPNVDMIVHMGYQARSRQLLDAKNRGLPILVPDLGYFSDRRQMLSLGFNGINGVALRPSPGVATRLHPELQPWVSHDEDKFLVCGQLAGDASIGIDRLHDTDRWATELIAELAITSPNATVDYRPHPYAVNSGSLPPIESFIRQYSYVFTWSSNVAVDAIFAGVPATADSEVSMIWGWAKQFGGSGDRDDMRRKWAKWLSWTQFTPAEYKSGFAARHVMQAYDEARTAAESGYYA